MKDLFGEETVRTLGLYQPFATLMGCGKEIETRWVQEGRMAPFPEGTYLLYSTQKAYSMKEFVDVAGFYAQKGYNYASSDETFNVNGCALWVGRLVKRAYLKPDEREKAFVDVYDDYFENGKFTHLKEGHVFGTFEKSDLWGLHFEDVKRIKPFVFKGKQGVGILTKEQKELIEFV
jgi:hypothetical protein